MTPRQYRSVSGNTSETKALFLRLSEEEKLQVDQAAASYGMSINNFASSVLLAAISDPEVVAKVVSVQSAHQDTIDKLAGG